MRINALCIGGIGGDKDGVVVVVGRQVVNKAAALWGVYFGFVADGVIRARLAQDGRAGDGAEPDLCVRRVLLQGACGEFAVVVVFAAGEHENFAPCAAVTPVLWIKPLRDLGLVRADVLRVFGAGGLPVQGKLFRLETLGQRRGIVQPALRVV